MERSYGYCAAEKRDELASLHAPTRHIQCETLALCDRAASEKWHTTERQFLRGAMSALGHKQTFWSPTVMFAFSSIADIRRCQRHVHWE